MNLIEKGTEVFYIFLGLKDGSVGFEAMGEMLSGSINIEAEVFGHKINAGVEGKIGAIGGGASVKLEKGIGEKAEGAYAYGGSGNFSYEGPSETPEE